VKQNAFENQPLSALLDRSLTPRRTWPITFGKQFHWACWVQGCLCKQNYLMEKC